MPSPPSPLGAYAWCPAPLRKRNFVVSRSSSSAVLVNSAFFWNVGFFDVPQRSTSTLKRRVSSTAIVIPLALLRVSQTPRVEVIARILRSLGYCDGREIQTTLTLTKRRRHRQQ